MEIADDISVFTQFYNQMKVESDEGGKNIPSSQLRENAGTSRGTPSLRRSVGMSCLLRSPPNAIASGMSPGDFLQFNEEREEAKLKQYYQVLLTFSKCTSFTGIMITICFQFDIFQDSVRDQRHRAQELSHLEETTKEECENNLKELSKELQKVQEQLAEDSNSSTSPDHGPSIKVFHGTEISTQQETSTGRKLFSFLKRKSVSQDDTEEEEEVVETAEQFSRRFYLAQRPPDIPITVSWYRRLFCCL